jgi:hypothetical protein
VTFLDSIHSTPAETPAQAFEKEAAAAEAAEKPAPADAVSEAPEAAPAEPVQEAASEPEAAVESPKPVHEPLEEGQRVVSVKALQEERAKRQAMERKLAELEARLSQPAQPQPQEQTDAEPDPEIDPIGYLKHIKAEHERRKAMEAETVEEQRLMAAYRADAASFRQEAPDFQDAYNYLIKSRVQELQAIGTDPAEIPAIIKNDELGIAARARALGTNAAQIAYSFAKARGYGGPKPAEPAPAAPAVAQPDMQKARQAVAATAAAGGKAAAPKTITPEDAANLKGAAFDAWWDKHFHGNSEGSLFRR